MEWFSIWLLNVNVGPSDVIALKFGTPLIFILVHGSSRVPFSCSFIIAFDIRPFCLRTALVIMYAVSFDHIGTQLTLGIAWWMATLRSLVPLTCEVRKSCASTSSLQVSRMKRTNFLKRSSNCMVVIFGLAMSAAARSLMGNCSMPP